MRILKSFKKILWSLTVAIMVGLHNFYHQEYHSPDELKAKIENIQEESDSSGK